jgi:hypothetical protein
VSALAVFFSGLDFGEAEVENLRLIAPDENVGWFDVAVNDPCAWATSSASAT